MGGIDNDNRKGSVGPAIIRHNGCEIKEFPVSTKEILGKQIIFSGGGYFRLASYYLLHLSNLSKLHCIRFARTFKSYVGLKGARELARLRNDITRGIDSCESPSTGL